MSKTIIPANYTPALNLYDTQRAIGTVKRLFADTLCATLNLYRVSAPLFLEASTGLNDDLNGVERKVTFDIKDSGTEAQVVQSLAKWKRKALKDYGFRVRKVTFGVCKGRSCSWGNMAWRFISVAQTADTMERTTFFR